MIEEPEPLYYPQIRNESQDSNDGNFKIKHYRSDQANEVKLSRKFLNRTAEKQQSGSYIIQNRSQQKLRGFIPQAGFKDLPRGPSTLIKNVDSKLPAIGVATTNDSSLEDVRSISVPSSVYFRTKFKGNFNDAKESGVELQFSSRN